MAKLNVNKNTTKNLLVGVPSVQTPRPYLGMSQIGNECTRASWYSFRWAVQVAHPQRLLRLFNRGHREEPVLNSLLESVGYTVHGDQTEAYDIFGHFRGHCDGMVDGVIEAPKTTHLLEYKTMSDKKFKSLCKDKLKKANPTYYAQVQLYMHYLKLTRALFISVNKNDDDIYVERIRYDKERALFEIEKARTVVLSEFPLPRAYTSSTFFMCKWCDYREQCWKGAALHQNCRTCKFSEPNKEGGWTCNYYDNDIPLDFQRVGCDDYSPLISNEV